LEEKSEEKSGTGTNFRPARCQVLKELRMAEIRASPHFSETPMSRFEGVADGGNSSQSHFSETGVSGTDTAWKPVLWVLLAAVFCYVAALGVFSYKQDLPFEDVLWDAWNARALLNSGTIPAHGDVNSFFALNPPGISWGFVPGLLIFPKEIALAEKANGLILVALTLLGLYLLSARRMGSAAAVLVCLVFLLSERGLFFAGSLWPRAHPVFLVWMIYFIDRWVTERRPWALASALILWLASDYWMLEGITSIVLIPMVWLAFRPKVRWREVAVAAAAGGLIWSPYLAFEFSRGLVDLRATLTRTSPITDYDAAARGVLHDQSLKTVENRRPHQVEGISPEPTPEPGKPAYRWIVTYSVGSRPEWIYQAVNETEEKGVRGRWTWAQSHGGWSFQPTEAERVTQAGSGVPGFAGFWKLVLASMPVSLVPSGQGMVLFVVASSVLWAFRGWLPQWVKAGRIAGLLRIGAALGLAGTALLALRTPASTPAFTRGESYSVIAFCGLSLGAIAISKFWSGRLLRPVDAGVSGALPFTLAVAAFFPWVIAMALMLHDPVTLLSRRFLWLWPVQGMLLMAMLWNLRVPRGVTVAAVAGLLFVVAWNPDLVDRTALWRHSGFRFAPPNDENQALDFLGQRIRQEGRGSAAIGYDVAFRPWFLLCRSVDGRSKVGMSDDEILLLRYGITNLDTTAEGIRPEDEFRVVERSSLDPTRQTYFDLSAYPRMALIYQNSNFIVLGGGSRQ
jgi:hypothetical protein